VRPGTPVRLGSCHPQLPPSPAPDTPRCCLAHQRVIAKPGTGRHEHRQHDPRADPSAPVTYARDFWPGPARGAGQHAAYGREAPFGGPAVVRAPLPGLPPGNPAAIATGSGCQSRRDKSPRLTGRGAVTSWAAMKSASLTSAGCAGWREMTQPSGRFTAGPACARARCCPGRPGRSRCAAGSTPAFPYIAGSRGPPAPSAASTPHRYGAGCPGSGTEVPQARELRPYLAAAAAGVLKVKAAGGVPDA
jgi:hypothetical protein